jgi:tetratricopeptide (TPR) repeat protein
MPPSRLPFPLAFLCLAALASSAVAQPALSGRPAPAADRYQTCLNNALSMPDGAYEDAMAWRAEGGGAPAEHCAAVALTGLRKYEEAAARLDRLASSPSAGDVSLRAQILAQAGNAWLLAGRPEQAIQSFNAALSLAPDDPDTLMDRARASAIKENWAGAERDLSAALAANPSSVDALVLRASARRAQGNVKGAEGDITRALLLDANSLNALVEYGLIRAAKGDKGGAREAFLAVLAKAPDSPAADSARAEIARLDVPQPRAPRVLPAKP